MAQILTFDEIEEITAPLVGTFITDQNQTYVSFDSTVGGITYKLHWHKSDKDNLFHLTSTEPQVE